MIVAPDMADPRPPPEVLALHEMVAAAAPGADLEVIESAQPAAALVAIAGEDADGVILLGGTGGDEKAPLGPFAAEVVATSRRAVAFAPPTG
jgi:hypothetical protein